MIKNYRKRLRWTLNKQHWFRVNRQRRRTAYKKLQKVKVKLPF